MINNKSMPTKEDTFSVGDIIRRKNGRLQYKITGTSGHASTLRYYCVNTFDSTPSSIPRQIAVRVSPFKMSEASLASKNTETILNKITTPTTMPINIYEELQSKEFFGTKKNITDIKVMQKELDDTVKLLTSAYSITYRHQQNVREIRKNIEKALTNNNYCEAGKLIKDFKEQSVYLKVFVTKSLTAIDKEFAVKEEDKPKIEDYFNKQL